MLLPATKPSSKQEIAKPVAHALGWCVIVCLNRSVKPDGCVGVIVFLFSIFLSKEVHQEQKEQETPFHRHIQTHIEIVARFPIFHLDTSFLIVIKKG